MNHTRKDLKEWLGRGVPYKRPVSTSSGWHDKWASGTGETTITTKEASGKTY